jgi:hypothetical protein
MRAAAWRTVRGWDAGGCTSLASGLSREGSNTAVGTRTSSTSSVNSAFLTALRNTSSTRTSAAAGRRARSVTVHKSQWVAAYGNASLPAQRGGGGQGM